LIDDLVAHDHGHHLVHKFIEMFSLFDESAFSFGSERTVDHDHGHEVSARGSNATSESSGP
jgi:hypothetical protein